MIALACFVIYVIVDRVSASSSFKYGNVTSEPALRQLYDFKQDNPIPIGLLTTSSGEPVEIRDTIQLNADQFTNQYLIDLHTSFDAEKIPERVVHAKGAGALGYFIVTHDVSKYTSADLFNGIGKKTPVLTRFSPNVQGLGGTDLARESKGMAVKFYTKQGNLDLLGLQTPAYMHRDPVDFIPLTHVLQKNPRTALPDFTAVWDFMTLKPDGMHAFLWVQSDYGVPNGYRKMDGFAINTFELVNKDGVRHYVKFNFRTEQGVDNLRQEQIARIQGTDLNYGIRDLYNAIERKNYPSWRLEIDIMSFNEITNLDYNPFDVTRLWINGTYKTEQIGRLILNKNPDNAYRDIELAAFNPGNLVPGIPGPVDEMFKTRRVFYRDAINYRLGTNHNKININQPYYAKTYNRNGKTPVKYNMKDIPNYYPNSFSGPIPYVDENRPKEKLFVLERRGADLEPSSYFYNFILKNDAERQRLIDNLVTTLEDVLPFVRKRGVQLLYLVDPDLGKRVDLGLKVILSSKTEQSESMS